MTARPNVLKQRGAIGRVMRAGALILGFRFLQRAAGLPAASAGGMLALARRDLHALSALAVGAALALPLFAAYVAAGCSLSQAFLLSSSVYVGM